MDWNWEPEDLSLAVRFLRALRGWSQTELAEKIGWEESRISRLESGKEVAGKTELQRLARAVHLPFLLLEATLPLLRLLRCALGKPEISGVGLASHVIDVAEEAADGIAATTRLTMTVALLELKLLWAEQRAAEEEWIDDEDELDELEKGDWT